MGNTKINKVLPAFDMLLVLVVVLFATAGLLRSVPPTSGIDPNEYEALLAEQSRLEAEIESKKAEADRLEQDMEDSPSHDAPPETLETLLHAASGKQERIAEGQLLLADMREELDGVIDVVQEIRNADDLKKEIERLKKEFERLESEKKALEEKITDADRERAEILRLQERLTSLLKEIEDLLALVEEAGHDPLRRKLPEKSPSWHGPHLDRYLLLECDDKGAVVYPGGRRIPLTTTDERREWLEGEIKRVGAAVLVVRPSGFKESYAKFHTLLTEVAKKEKEATGTNQTALSFWPIEASESIEPYLPKE